MAAKAMGYRVVVFDAAQDGPAVSCADLAFTAPFDDLDALGRFASEVDVATVEFENIPVGALEFLETLIPVRPSARAVSVCQDRIREKAFLREGGFPVGPCHPVTSAEELAAALSDLAAPSILKTACLGYDGKGQISLLPEADASAAWARLGAPRAILEKRIPFVSECSVLCARSPLGETLCFPVQANVHRDGILDLSRVPSGLPAAVEEEARRIASGIASSLGIAGLIAVEFFVLEDGVLLVNELAPRPHNSGHHTLETTLTSQFSQHVRAVCGLPLGPVQLRSPGVMANLLGDLWGGGVPDWKGFLSEPGLFLHLYGKTGAKPGRKMGHATLLGEPLASAARLMNLREALCPTAEKPEKNL